MLPFPQTTEIAMQQKLQMKLIICLEVNCSNPLGFQQRRGGQFESVSDMKKKNSSNYWMCQRGSKHSGGSPPPAECPSYPLSEQRCFCQGRVLLQVALI